MNTGLTFGCARTQGIRFSGADRERPRSYNAKLKSIPGQTPWDTFHTLKNRIEGELQTQRRVDQLTNLKLISENNGGEISFRAKPGIIELIKAQHEIAAVVEDSENPRARS